ncbi:MAG TPA: ABC transporter substrate-binding protein [Gammaproteobacteria bacterium]
MKKLLTSLSMALLLISLPAQAAEMQPDELIKSTSEKVLSTLEQNREKYKEQPDEINQLVNDIILPHLDFRAMSKLALGKNWRSATEDQQNRFVDAFKNMLIRTYSKSLTEYAGQEIVFLPYRPPAEGKRTVTVQTQIKQNDGPVIPIDYSLRIKDDIWKVYDIKIDGISLVTNYRNTFAADINQLGMEGLIKKLLAKSDDKPEEA